MWNKDKYYRGRYKTDRKQLSTLYKMYCEPTLNSFLLSDEELESYGIYWRYLNLFAKKYNVSLSVAVGMIRGI